MSTRCAVIIRVKDEHIGKTLKFSEDSLPCKLDDWGNQSDKSKSEEVTINKPYLGIYCHNDGYFDGVGSVLKELFKSYEHTLDLVLGGDCSIIWYNRVLRYADRKNEEWEYLQPKQGDTPFEVGDMIGHNGYVYLFEDGMWKVQSGKNFAEYDENGVV